MKNSQEFVKEKTFNRAREKIKRLKKEKPDEEVVFIPEGKDRNSEDELNRKILDKTSYSSGDMPDIVVINLSDRKDFQKQRNSGFNQVMAKSLSSNHKGKIKVGINFSEVLQASGKERAKILGRLKQNIDLCKKNKIQMEFVFLYSEKENVHRNRRDLKSLGLVLGMPTWMLNEVF